MSKKEPKPIPTVEEIQMELDRIKYKRRYRSVLRSTIYTLVVVAAVAILVATLWLPVLQIYGSSMSPTLNEGDVVVSIKKLIISRGMCWHFITTISFWSNA